MSEVVFMHTQEHMPHLGSKINWLQDSKLNKTFQLSEYVTTSGYCDLKQSIRFIYYLPVFMSLFYPESVLNNSCSLYIHFKIKFNTRHQPKLGKQVLGNDNQLWDITIKSKQTQLWANGNKGKQTLYEKTYIPTKNNNEDSDSIKQIICLCNTWSLKCVLQT